VSLSSKHAWARASGSGHAHLAAGGGGAYAARLVARLWDALGRPEGARGVEIGCGEGRFTFALLERCRALDAVDLSPEQLERLRGELARRGVAAERCALHRADAERGVAALEGGERDFLVGLFILHHLRDPRAALERLIRVLRPGGTAAFLEPNPWNPLYALQISLSPGMRWREEWRMYRLTARRLATLFASAGFGDVSVERAGFFPPQVLNRSRAALRLEARLEGVRALGPLLPFQIVRGSRSPARRR
jgi:SAM-dependent methyltransferase